MKNPRVSRNLKKIRAEINAKETKETIAKINKAKMTALNNTLLYFIGQLFLRVKHPLEGAGP